MRTVFFDNDAKEIIQQSLMVLFFIPRMLLFLCTLSAYMPCAWLLAVLSERKLVSNKIPKMVFQRVCVLVLALLGIRISHSNNSVHTSHHSPGSLIIANHISYLDIVILGFCFSTVFVSKKEVLSWPFFGSIASSIGCIFVNRKNLQSRVRAIQNIAERISKGENVALFPEGTTTFYGVPSQQRWNSGQIHAAISANKPIILCAITYENQETAAWTGNQSLFPHIVRQFLLGSRQTILNIEYWQRDPATDTRELSSKLHARICAMCLANHHNLMWKTVEQSYAYS